MSSDKVVTTADVLESIRRVRRIGRQRILRDLEQREPDLTEHLLEELSLIHQKLAEMGPTSKQVRRIYRRVELLAVVLVSALETAQGRMWMDFILTTKPYKTKPTAPVEPPLAVASTVNTTMGNIPSSATPIVESATSPSISATIPIADPTADFLIRRRIVLAMAGGRLMAHPDPNCGAPFEPFPLPRLPITLVYWCQALCRLHFKRTRTRLIVLLMLDRSTGRWQPVVPTQVCSRGNTGLVLRTTDLTGLSDSSLIAGSLQTTGDSHLTMAVQAVPQLDGLHVVRHVCSTWAFVRAGNKITLADPATVTVDDVRQSLDGAAGRLLAR